VTGYPADGLNPLRLAQILRSADHGDPVRYLELAEAIEERDSHYVGVLGTRKRAVSQLDITVEDSDDSPIGVEMAERVRKWLKRGELTNELFHILDAVGKGYSFTEIIWESSEGQWQPKELKLRDPRWFRFERHNLETPLMLDNSGNEATSFQSIKDGLRRDIAIRDLTQSVKSIEAISQDIGFASAANFHRAFKRWTDVTPGTYRKLSRSNALKNEASV
jgi:phage gp29-like protein